MNRDFYLKRYLVFYGILLSFFLLFNSCVPSELSIAPPSQLKSMEGYGSLRISGENGAAKLRFSFLFSLPNLGRIESFDLLGRSLYFILIDEKNAYFVLPSKRVYWQGKTEEIISRFIGVRLNQHEIISLIRGQWDSKTVIRKTGETGDTWSFVRDKEGKIISGKRGGFRFEIKEFFPRSSFARFLLFNNPWNKGSIKILLINFNQPIKPEAFSSSSLDGFEPKTWAEIESMIGK